MNDSTTVHYALSTLAQTCAALAALVGAVGLYKLQLLRDEHARNEQTIRGILFYKEDRRAQMMPLDELLKVARGYAAPDSKLLPSEGRARLVEALAERDGFPNQRWRVTRALFFFEGWNLLVIGASLVGFNYIPLLAAAAWAYWALWAVALGTLGVTIRCVSAWTSEGGDMPDSPKLTPETGKLEVQGSPVGLIVTRAAETWQFFAFVFAAAVTLALALLDELPERPVAWRIAAKLVAFFGLAYLMLRNNRVRNWLAGWLPRFKEERR